MDAIVIVDLQRAFLVPPEIIERIRVRAERFPLRIFTRFINPPGSLWRKKLGRQSCPPGSPETELILSPRPTDLVFDKPGYGLVETQVAQIREAGIRHVLVCGVDTDACVLGVVTSLFDGDVDCSVDPSLCWSSTGLHEAALAIIREQFGTPGDLHSVVES